jgi:DNA gyrase subunit A
MIKLVDGGEFDVSKRTTAATKLADKDLVVCVGIVHEGDTVVMQSEEGLFLRIDGITIPEKKKAAVGVRGIRLGAKDRVHAMYILSEGDTKTVKVKGKEVVLNRLHIGNRDTKGVKR